MAVAKAKTPAKVKVLLTQPLIDGGAEYAPGATLETDSTTAAWLVSNKIGTVVVPTE